MNPPQPDQPGTEVQALTHLGLRAAWLHLTITGRRGAGLSPRDRELLCVVATASTRGVDQETLLDSAAALGISGPAALRRAHQLVDQDLLSRASGRFDLPAADLRWIAGQLARLERQTRP